MAGDQAHHERLTWTRGEPIWPREPEVEVVRSLAKYHLAAELPSPLDDTLMKVSFFDQGGFNKLYKICYTGHHASYLLRATVPIEPYYKIESEVATIAYLRANTTIPVPRVFAWNSNRDNELTFEWILMEKIDGISLSDLWRKVPWERKLELTETIAGMIKQLRDQKFDSIGGLYFKSAVNHQTTKTEEVAKTKTVGERLHVDESVKEPVDEHVERPVNEQVNEPVDERVEKRMSEPVDEPVDELVEVPLDEQVEGLMGEPVEELLNEQVVEQVDESGEKPIEKPVEEPVKEKVTEPVEERLDEPMREPVDEPVDELVVELVNALVEEVVNEPVDEVFDAGYDAAEIDTSDIAIPLALQSLQLDARKTAETESPTAGLQRIVNNDPNKLEHVVSWDGDGPDGLQEAGTTGTTTIEPHAGSEKENSTSRVSQAEFAVGRMFDALFFVGNRPYLPANRGPYRNSLEWLSALVRVQLEWIKHGSIEDDEEYDSDFEEDRPMRERLCKGFLDILPRVCSDEGRLASFCLHHSDLNAANILLNPDTFEITGIVDWEFINVVPEWRAFEHPLFLQNIEPMSEEEPPIPIYEDNEDDTAVYVRDRWDDRILRRHFDQTMNQLTQGDGDYTDYAMKMRAMRDCREYIPPLTDMWNWSKMWLKDYKTTGVSKNREDRMKETHIYGENDSDAEDYTWLDTTQS